MVFYFWRGDGSSRDLKKKEKKREGENNISSTVDFECIDIQNLMWLSLGEPIQKRRGEAQPARFKLYTV